jgi:PEP-CTERM motif
LLVGNFSFAASEINAFDPTNGAFRGTIPIDVGAGNTPGGLWALIVGNGGNGGNGGDPHTVYFSDGINGEADGLFASLSPVPEPGTSGLLGSGLAAIAGIVWTKHRKRVCRRQSAARPPGGRPEHTMPTMMLRRIGGQPPNDSNPRPFARSSLSAQGERHDALNHEAPRTGASRSGGHG